MKTSPRSAEADAASLLGSSSRSSNEGPASAGEVIGSSFVVVVQEELRGPKRRGCYSHCWLLLMVPPLFQSYVRRCKAVQTRSECLQYAGGKTGRTVRCNMKGMFALLPLFSSCALSFPSGGWYLHKHRAVGKTYQQYEARSQNERIPPARGVFRTVLNGEFTSERASKRMC